jgi:Phospholipid methyltransferase
MARSAVSRAIRVGKLMLAMSGWRIERLRPAWVMGGLASIALARVVTHRSDAALAYFALSVVFYYGGNALVLWSGLGRAWVARLGEERAFRVYEMLLAMMFLNQGLGLGAATASGEGSLPISAPLALAVGLPLAAIGLLVKVWATEVLGVDVYYYKDLFLGRPVSAFAARGPYRVLANPMYGVGQLHAYGYALAYRSTSGLLAAALCHGLIYAFYFAVERPFVLRIHAA